MTADLSRLILGGAGYAGLYAAVNDSAAAETLGEAWQAGVRTFDTAPHYGAGLSEERLGAFLATHVRSDFSMSTKVGRLLVDDDGAPSSAEGFVGARARRRVRDYSADGVVRSLSESAARMSGVGCDVALIHDPDNHVAQAVSEAAPALSRLRADGRVRGFGLGVNDADLADHFVTNTDLDHVLIAGRYTLLDRRAQQLLAHCADREITVWVGGVLNSGLLADPQQRSTFDYQDADPAILAHAVQLQQLCARYQVPLRAAALQFPLRHPAVSSVVCGAANADEVVDTIAMMNVVVPEELWTQLELRPWIG